MNMHAGGVDYKRLDKFKIDAAHVALSTAGYILEKGWHALEWTYGESAFAFANDETGMVIAVVAEGLGTKNMVAEDPALRQFYQRTFYDDIAQCLTAAIANDLITIGAVPLVFMQHMAVAEGAHLEGDNGADLISGTANAMRTCKMAWGGGETPELQGIINPGTACMGGVAVGFRESERLLINPENIRAGQRIVLLGSSGIHANGLSRARKLAKVLEKEGSYLVRMMNGVSFGKELLTPTVLYEPFMAACRQSSIRIAYAINMTGHGYAKIMRAKQPFTYRLKKLLMPQEVFRFLQEHLAMTNNDMYSAFNMGAGFALIVDAQYVPALMTIGATLDIPVLDAGVVEEGPKQVIIELLNITLDELSIR